MSMKNLLLGKECFKFKLRDVIDAMREYSERSQEKLRAIRMARHDGYKGTVSRKVARKIKEHLKCRVRTVQRRWDEN